MNRLIKIALLVLLGFLWSARLTAIKAAGLSGIPVHVTISLAVLGVAVLFSALAVKRGAWPPVDKSTLRFYFLSGALGFILPFILENLVAPHLPVFVFIVIIATMPLMTLFLAVMLKIEKPERRQYIAIGLGFGVALLIAGDAVGGSVVQDWTWVTLAFGVPLLYAVNTLFIASRWPSSADALHVAHAQALIVSIAVIIGNVATGAIDQWHLAELNIPAIAGIVFFEGFALLVYLKITRDHGATFVSMANYVSMVFAAILGALLFGDQLTWLSVAAAAVLIISLSVNQLKSK